MTAAVDFRDNPNRACAPQSGVDPEWFFIENAAVTKALAVCARCPVRAACLAHALAKPERYGVWGGYSANQRERIRRGR